MDLRPDFWRKDVLAEEVELRQHCWRIGAGSFGGREEPRLVLVELAREEVLFRRQEREVAVQAEVAVATAEYAPQEVIFWGQDGLSNPGNRRPNGSRRQHCAC